MFYPTIVDRQTITPPHLPSRMAPFNSQSNHQSGYNLGIFSNFIDYYTNYLRVYLIKLILIMQIMLSKTEIKNPIIPHKITVLGQISNNYVMTLGCT